MNATPLVSVVIPTYNRLPLLRQAVQSVRAQTYPNWELIVVDDGSSDETRAFVETVSDANVRLVSLPHCGIVGAVRNAGARTARGEYLAFLDSDDLWLPAKLESQLRQTQNAVLLWSYTRYENINEGGAPVAMRSGAWKPYSGDILPELITTEAAVSMSTLLVTRALFQEVSGFDEDPTINFREDYDLALRLALRKRTLAVPELLVQIREHDRRSTRHLPGAQPFLATARVYDRILPDLPNAHLKRLARKRRAGLLAEAGAQSLKAGSLRSGARYFLRSLLDRPLSRQWASALARGLGLKR